MNTRVRNGKIARLPLALREELNTRLECSEEGSDLLPWLNGLPEVQTLLKDKFGGAPINKQNLSDWRQGGFQEWLARRSLAEEARELAQLSGQLETDIECGRCGRRCGGGPAWYAGGPLGWEAMRPLKSHPEDIWK